MFPKNKKIKNMKKCLVNGLESGGTYQLRTTEFKPVADFKIVIAEFEKMYDFFDEIQPLFNIDERAESIVLTANTFMFNFENEDIDIDEEEIWGNDCEGLKNYLKSNNISELTSEILCEMTEYEEFSVRTLVKKIAQTGQIINVELTDLTNGNSEFNITT
jgi:hypothetical protein